MAYDVYIYGTKRGQDTLLSHGGNLGDDETLHRSDGEPVVVKGAGTVIGERIAKLDGQEPEQLLKALDRLPAKALEVDTVRDAVASLRAAAEHAIGLAAKPQLRDVYADLRVVVRQG
jgi:hypothetical protein